MDDRVLLVRYRDGDLTGAETERVSRRLREEPELRARLERLEWLAEGLHRSAAASFEPFFATRVMAALRRRDVTPGEGMYEALRHMFAGVAVACLVVAVGLAVYSAVGGGYGGSVVETMLGLPETTLETALTLGG
jgi:anti-sigma factor RsiW